MQKTKTVLNMALAISLISIAISVNESFAQTAPDASISNVIIIPDNAGTAKTAQTVNNPMITMITLMPNMDSATARTSTSNGIDLPTALANKANQSPFQQVSSGSYDVGIAIPDGYTLIDAKCKIQKPSGKWISIGIWDGESIIAGVDLAANKAHKCTWKLAPETP